MPSFPRSELEEMMQRWLDLNQRCEGQLDWLPLADMYTEDATYGWNVGPNDEFMAVGRDEIREFDVGNATATFIEMIDAGALSPGMQKRIERAAAGGRQPGHYPVGQAPVGLWEGCLLYTSPSPRDG